MTHCNIHIKIIFLTNYLAHTDIKCTSEVQRTHLIYNKAQI
jgi:hypothetical protein